MEAVFELDLYFKFYVEILEKEKWSTFFIVVFFDPCPSQPFNGRSRYREEQKVLENEKNCKIDEI